MPDTSEIEVRRTEHAGGLVLTPVGDVDLSRAASLRAQLVTAIEGRPARVVVDMSEVEYMDSSGVATLIEAMQTARERSVRFVLCALKDQVLATLQITRLDIVFTICDSPDEALAA